MRVQQPPTLNPCHFALSILPHSEASGSLSWFAHLFESNSGNLLLVTIDTKHEMGHHPPWNMTIIVSEWFQHIWKWQTKGLHDTQSSFFQISDKYRKSHHRVMPMAWTDRVSLFSHVERTGAFLKADRGSQQIYSRVGGTDLLVNDPTGWTGQPKPEQNPWSSHVMLQILANPHWLQLKQ